MTKAVFLQRNLFHLNLPKEGLKISLIPVPTLSLFSKVLLQPCQHRHVHLKAGRTYLSNYCTTRKAATVHLVLWLWTLPALPETKKILTKVLKDVTLLQLKWCPCTVISLMPTPQFVSALLKVHTKWHLKIGPEIIQWTYKYIQA